jgi:hypothetical protein
MNDAAVVPPRRKLFVATHVEDTESHRAVILQQLDDIKTRCARKLLAGAARRFTPPRHR